MNIPDRIAELAREVERIRASGDTEGTYSAYRRLSGFISLHLGGPIIGEMYYRRDLRKRRAVEATKESP